MLGHCVDGNVDEAYKVVEQLWALGYSPEDIIGNIFRVCKTYQMAEYLKLEFIKVRRRLGRSKRALDHLLRNNLLSKTKNGEALGICRLTIFVRAGDWLHAHAHHRGRQLPAPVGRTGGSSLQ